MENVNTNELVELVADDSVESIDNSWGGCSVCGMDEWCGTDGCPMDPQ